LDAAAEAGMLIDQIDKQIKSILWQDWTNGFNKPSFDTLWTNAVFELAWQEHIGSALRAKRWIWHHHKKLETRDLLRVNETDLGSLLSDLISHVGDVPVYWYSWLPNLSRASHLAIEIIKELMKTMSTQQSTFEDSEKHNTPKNNGPSIFISYSHKDEEFAQQLYTHLRSKGFTAWYATEDMKGGEKIFEQIDMAIKRHDRLMVILSETSMNSAWVQTEIYKARKRSKLEKKRILFPISLVPYSEIEKWECFDSDTGTDMAREIREFFIPDFQHWKDAESFSKAFDRLVRDLSDVEGFEAQQISDEKVDSSFSDKIRDIARRVRSVPDEIVASFANESADERLRKVTNIVSAIYWESIPLITWIERNRPLSADIEKRRFDVLENDACFCSTQDIPEYRGGVINPQPQGSRPSQGAKKVAELLVFCMAFETSILGWADEIERHNPS
jgi:hypothetical protein